jgi:hypothetical protein
MPKKMHRQNTVITALFGDVLKNLFFGEKISILFLLFIVIQQYNAEYALQAFFHVKENP